MDANLFYFGSVIILTLGLLGVGIKGSRGVLFAFIGGVFGMVFAVQLNADGTIQGLASGAPSGIWPIMYIPIFFILLDFAIAIYEGMH